MKVYKIFTRKPDFLRVFGEEADIKDREFFVVTRCVETFRAIAIDKFYTDTMLNVCKNRLQRYIGEDLDKLGFDKIKELVLPLLFSQSLYDNNVQLDSPYDQYRYAIGQIAMMLSIHIELQYSFETTPDFHSYFGIHNIEEQDSVESVIFDMDMRYLRYEMNLFI
nr:Prolyl-tRNA synthetase-Proline--tRNA ligase [Moritella viscosa]